MANLLHKMTNLVRKMTNLLHKMTNLLHKTSNLLHEMTNLLHKMTYLLHKTTNLRHNTSNYFTKRTIYLFYTFRTSSESSGVDHDSERDEQQRAQQNNPRLSHPALPGMSPHDMMQKMMSLMNSANPGGPGMNPWAAAAGLGQPPPMQSFNSASPSMVPQPSSFMSSLDKSPSGSPSSKC